MLTGYNTDIKHEGVVYHVQTEDGGVDNPVIVSLVYQGGRILASRKTSYAQLLGVDGMLSQLKDLLENQHKGMIKGILTGALGATRESSLAAGGSAPPPGQPGEPSYQKPSAEADSPRPQAGASEKNLDQVILEYLASEIDND